jgi:hypothetical protein
VDTAPAENRWVTLFAQLLAGEYVGAADECGAIGLKPDEAFVRLRAGGRLLDTDHPEEARVQLEAALTFYRSVGATRYIREAEALLATIQSESERPARAQPRA